MWNKNNGRLNATRAVVGGLAMLISGGWPGLLRRPPAISRQQVPFLSSILDVDGQQPSSVIKQQPDIEQSQADGQRPPEPMPDIDVEAVEIPVPPKAEQPLIDNPELEVAAIQSPGSEIPVVTFNIEVVPERPDRSEVLTTPPAKPGRKFWRVLVGVVKAPQCVVKKIAHK